MVKMRGGQPQAWLPLFFLRGGLAQSVISPREFRPTASPAPPQPGGLPLAEHAWNQGRRLREAARASFPDAIIETRRDLAGRERILVVQTA